MDLNPVRAGIAKTPESSDFTIALDRIAELKTADEVSTAIVHFSRMLLEQCLHVVPVVLCAAALAGDNGFPGIPDERRMLLTGPSG